MHISLKIFRFARYFSMANTEMQKAYKPKCEHILKINLVKSVSRSKGYRNLLQEDR